MNSNNNNNNDNKTRHLDNTIRMFRGPGGKPTAGMDMRAKYDAALRQRGWKLVFSKMSDSEWVKEHKRMRVENGDRVFVSFDNITWAALNAHAKRNILLASQV